MHDHTAQEVRGYSNSRLAPRDARAWQQPRRIQNERQLGCHVNEGRQERVEKTERSHADSYAVHDQRADKVLHDDPATKSCDAQGIHKLGKIASDQNHIRALPSDISSGTHSNSDVGLYQGRSVVDTISDHCDFSTFAAQLADPLRFLLWEQLSHGFVYPQLPAYRTGYGLRVSTEEDCFQSDLSHRRDGSLGLRA